MYLLFENTEYTFHTQPCRYDCNTVASTVICICGWRCVMHQGKLGTLFFCAFTSQSKCCFSQESTNPIHRTDVSPKFKMAETIIYEVHSKKNSTVLNMTAFSSSDVAEAAI